MLLLPKFRTQACGHCMFNQHRGFVASIAQQQPLGLSCPQNSAPDCPSASQRSVVSMDQLLGGPASIAVLASLLKHCGKAKDLSEGRRVHAYIARCGYDRNQYIGNCLLEMYGCCWSMEESRSVFDRLPSPNLYSWNLLVKAYGQNGNWAHAASVFLRMPVRDVVSWNAMISAFAQNGHEKEALQVFRQMLIEGTELDKVTLLCTLDACASLASLKMGQNIHVAIVGNRYEEDVVLATSLVNMYGKCNSLLKARCVFGRLSDRDIVSWNAMISAFVQNGHGKEALDLFRQMQLEGFTPNRITFVCILDACASLAALEEGVKVHAAISHVGYDQEVVIGTALLTMYGKCGSLHGASNAFTRMLHRNVVSWNAMIAALSQNGHDREAVALLYKLKHEEIVPDKITMVGVLDACGSMASLYEGRRIHAAVVNMGYENNLMVSNALINMYGKCGNFDDSETVFHKMPVQDSVSWNTMITAFAQNGSLDTANRIFGKMPCKDAASCNAIMTAFSQNGHTRKTLDLFHKMHFEGVKPNKISFLCALDACASLAALEEGHDVHAAIVDSSYEEDDTLGNTLVNMYGKCGNVANAMSVFNRMYCRSIVSWNTMITAMAQNGHAREALDIFIKMQFEGIKPDGVTLIAVLTACSFTGWVDDGKHCFVTFNIDYGMTHTVDHYLCMIDLLGRAGHLDEAEGLIKAVPCEKVAVAWFCLLGACRIHGDLGRAVRAANYCFELNPEYGSPYVMLSNICAAAA